MDDSTAAPSISIVIPVYNEEAILRAALVELIDSLDALGLDYEIILGENGSSDRTRELAGALS